MTRAPLTLERPRQWALSLADQDDIGKKPSPLIAAPTRCAPELPSYPLQCPRVRLRRPKAPAPAPAPPRPSSVALIGSRGTAAGSVSGGTSSAMRAARPVVTASSVSDHAPSRPRQQHQLPLPPHLKLRPPSQRQVRFRHILNLRCLHLKMLQVSIARLKALPTACLVLRVFILRQGPHHHSLDHDLAFLPSLMTDHLL